MYLNIMINMLKRIVFIGAIGIVLYSCETAKKISLSQPTSSEKTDTTKVSVSKLKPYSEVITTKAITHKGLITVHKVDEKYFFEIADSLLEKDILIVNRIIKAATDSRPQNGFYGYGGDEIGKSVIRFSKGINGKLFIKRISYDEISRDSTVNGMFKSVSNSNFQPIVAAFDINTISPDSSSSVIDVTDYLGGDNDVFFFNPFIKKIFGLGALQPDKSYIQYIRTFPLNTEIHTVKTYVKGDELSSYELNSSIILLPLLPMKPRMSDPRIGYFDVSYRDFDAPEGVRPASMITRWRLEPRDEDTAKYRKGELVEPKKPIIFYIDPATPKKWVPYLIQGVNDWQKAFEKAGFKNAIYALEAPTDDNTWSLEDARHNAIIYKSSVTSNAYGAQVHDPRTGEILESHVSWFHNVMSLLHDWYMVQAGPNDPNARKIEFDDSLMGQLIRFVSSHEIGHTLGLTHNFGASSTIPVDSLRSKSYVEANGFCPSIMDYARFNYVAQPEDSISEKGLMPRIGVYDDWAIEWGYRWLPQLKTREEEKAYMNHWILNKLNGDKRLWYGGPGLLGPSGDPRAQTEDLGDDAMKASHYGILNLKRVVANLINWTKEPNSDYTATGNIQAQVFSQYLRYLMHVAENVGGILENEITVEQKGVVYEFVSKDKQRAAVQFLQDELFTTPTWFMNNDLFPFTGIGMARNPLFLQKMVIADIVSKTNFTNMSDFYRGTASKTYTYSELLDDMESGIWKELNKHESIDVYRRDLQKAYAERLISLLQVDPQQRTAQGYSFQNEIPMDLISIIKGHIRKLVTQISKALPSCKDEATKWHLLDVRERLQQALNPSNVMPTNALPTGKTTIPTLGELLNNRKFDLPEFNY